MLQGVKQSTTLVASASCDGQLGCAIVALAIGKYFSKHQRKAKIMDAKKSVKKSEETSSTLTALESRFTQTKSLLNDSRRNLIQAMLDNPEEHFFLSSRKMAQRYGVDASTIVRTIQALGYEKYDDFVADLRNHFVTRITPYSVLKSATRENRSVQDHIRHSVERDSENIHTLSTGFPTERVVELARQIHRSRRIMIIGVDLAASLAWFLAYGLTPLGFDAEAPVGSSGNLQHKVDVLTNKDLLVAISFGRGLRDTVESVLRAKELGIPTFGITDSDTTPIATFCDTYLLASIASPSFTGSYVAPMVLLNTILIACAHLQPKRALALLEKTEDEYRTGNRWYTENNRRVKSAANGNGKTNRKISSRKK
jgi:DNA-binding MurR/RpiR family transcriptional regulator